MRSPKDPKLRTAAIIMIKNAFKQLHYLSGAINSFKDVGIPAKCKLPAGHLNSHQSAAG